MPDSSEGPQIAESDIKQVLRDTRKPKTAYVPVPKAAKAIGRLRPDANPEDYDLRKRMLGYKRQTTERFTNEVYGTTNFKVEPHIEASRKSIDKELNPEYFILLRMIATGEFRNFINPQALAAITTQNGYEALAARTIHERVDQIRQRDVKAGLGDQTTKALEIEVHSRKPYIDLKNFARLDALQDLGVAVTFDGIRELPQPYSFTMRDQLRALYELRKCNVIPKEFITSFHLNFGGADWNESLEDALLFRQLMDAANFLDAINIEPTFRHNEPGLYVTTSGIRKPLRQRFTVARVEGMAIVIRDSGVLETREHGEVDNFFTLAKDLSNIGALSEAATAYIRRNKTQTSIEPEKDRELAIVWENLKLENLRLAEKYHIKNAREFYAEVAREEDSTFDLENRWAQLRWNFVSCAKKHPAFIKEYRDLIIRARAKIKQIQRSPSYF